MRARALLIALAVGAAPVACTGAEQCDIALSAAASGCPPPEHPQPLGYGGAAGGMRFVDLGSVGGLDTVAVGVDDRVDVLLRAGPEDGPARLVRVAGGRRADLLPPAGWAVTGPAYLDGRGAVTGTVTGPGGATRAVRWPAPAGPAATTLPPSLPGPGTPGSPPPAAGPGVRAVVLGPGAVAAASPSGSVVLVVAGPAGAVRRAALWTARGRTDLGPVVDLTAVTDGGTVLGSVPGPGPSGPGPGATVGRQPAPPPGWPGRPAVWRAGRWTVLGDQAPVPRAADDTGLTLVGGAGSTPTVELRVRGRTVWSGPDRGPLLLRDGFAVVGDTVLTGAGPVATLAPLGAGGVEPVALDRCGRVVGVSVDPRARTRAALWTGGRPQTLAGRSGDSTARAVSRRGLVAGGYSPGVAGGPARAGLWPVPPCRA
jgi:hypothetical protein